MNDDLRAAAQAATAIPSWPGYEITPDGQVFSVWSNWRGLGRRQLKAFPNYDGYPAVRLTLLNGHRVHIAIHRLLADVFLPPRPSPLHELRHLNGDKTDSRADNLAWGTKADNAADRERHGRTAKGSRNGAAALTEDQVRAIRNLYRAGELQHVIAQAFHVHQTTVSRVVRGKWWAHVTD